MEKAITLSITILLLIFVTPILGVLFGALSGWIVSLILDEYVKNVLFALFPSLSSFSLAQIGGCLGFLGGYFRITQSSKN